MNLDGDHLTPVSFEFLADKSGPEPPRDEDGRLLQSWPDAGVIVNGGEPPKRMTLPVRWLRKHLSKRNSITVEGLRDVTRPSRPEPDVDDNGSATVAPHHWESGDDAGLSPEPHHFLHADAITFHTPDGDVRYVVERQPDKYVAGDAKGTKRVTPEVYAAGDTEVEHFFTLKLDNSKKG